MSEKRRLVLDIGGTFIKYGMADGSGCLIEDSVRQKAVDHSSWEIFTRLLQEIIREFRLTGTVEEACVAMPGPFDFTNGVSRMKHKLPAIYGKSLREPFEKEGIQVRFLHDSTAFILGEFYDGVLKNAVRPCSVMLGTGLGFSFIRDGKVCVNHTETPAFSLWCAPYLSGIAEDYVSTRAIKARYDGVTEVREIAERARNGDLKAVRALKETADCLSDILNPVLREFECDTLALGGQIAKAVDLLPLELSVPWKVSGHLNDAALRGAAWYGKLGRNACIDIIPEVNFSLKKRG
jgi:glucokinase